MKLLLSENKESTVIDEFIIESSIPIISTVFSSPSNIIETNILNTATEVGKTESIEAKIESTLSNITNDTTEYIKPIIKPSITPPLVEIEYIEPILQVHYPDGRTESTV